MCEPRHTIEDIRVLGADPFMVGRGRIYRPQLKLFPFRQDRRHDYASLFCQERAGAQSMGCACARGSGPRVPATSFDSPLDDGHYRDYFWIKIGVKMEVAMELRVQIDDKFMKKLQEQLKTNKASDVARDALTLLNWAVQEKTQGRDIASAEKDGDVHSRVAMPSLEKVDRSTPESAAGGGTGRRGAGGR